MARPLVVIVMGSASDMPVMSDAGKMLERFEIPHEEKIISAHRNPQTLNEYVSQLKDRHIEVVIAGAGKAAHLGDDVLRIAV